MSTSTERLSTYLNDHLGGASTGVELARTLEEDVAGTPDAITLGPLASEIEQDREVLRKIVDSLGAQQNPVKEAAGWVAEKAHRLAVSETVVGDPRLSLLLATETLALGVEGKIALWNALRAVVPGHPQLATVDLDSLVVRARDQRRRLEELRISTARKAFLTV